MTPTAADKPAAALDEAGLGETHAPADHTLD
jgi:hypothetical protein